MASGFLMILYFFRFADEQSGILLGDRRGNVSCLLVNSGGFRGEILPSGASLIPVGMFVKQPLVAVTDSLGRSHGTLVCGGNAFSLPLRYGGPCVGDFIDVVFGDVGSVI